jgi:hypothetical protein
MTAGLCPNLQSCKTSDQKSCLRPAHLDPLHSAEAMAKLLELVPCGNEAADWWIDMAGRAP